MLQQVVMFFEFRSYNSLIQTKWWANSRPTALLLKIQNWTAEGEGGQSNVGLKYHEPLAILSVVRRLKNVSGLNVRRLCELNRVLEARN
jgi:hypothetical protein